GPAQLGCGLRARLLVAAGVPTTIWAYHRSVTVLRPRLRCSGVRETAGRAVRPGRPFTVPAGQRDGRGAVPDRRAGQVAGHETLLHASLGPRLRWTYRRPYRCRGRAA